MQKNSESTDKGISLPHTKPPLAPLTDEQLKERIKQQAIRHLAEQQDAGRLDPVTAIQTIMGAEKLQVDTEYRKQKIRETTEGALFINDAKKVAKEVCDEYADSIRAVAGEDALVAIAERQAANIEKIFKVAAAKMVKERRANERNDD